jgi:hypothetical protein
MVDGQRGGTTPTAISEDYVYIPVLKRQVSPLAFTIGITIGMLLLFRRVPVSNT